MYHATETVEKTAKCKRCGSQTVAWQTSRKTGRYYLTEVFTTADGLATDHRDFHSAYCELPERHSEKQAEIDVQSAADNAAKDAHAKAVADSKADKLRRTQEEADAKVLGWYSITVDEIRERLPAVEAELAEEERRLAVETAPANRYTMDDFYEQNKQLARIAAHKISIRVLTAERDVLKARLENLS